MNTDDDDLPARARRARKQLRLTQELVAEKAGVALRTYQAFETRKGNPTPENLRAIVRVLGIAEGDDVALATRSRWPLDVQVFLDVIGAYLATIPDEEARLAAIHDLTRQIFEARRTA